MIFPKIKYNLKNNTMSNLSELKPSTTLLELKPSTTLLELKPSNVVGTFYFEPAINTNIIFRLCQLTNTNSGSEYDISYMTYQDHSRGKRLPHRSKKLNKPNKTKRCASCFKNTIIMDMGTSITLKLSHNSLWMSGFKNHEIKNSIFDSIKHKLSDIQKMLDIINEDIELSKRVIM
ncbi:MAG TPA: hypothetical protein VKR58_04290, partial [Aquella sp.]|nr:hypothetical protein [Aquella sp.]